MRVLFRSTRPVLGMFLGGAGLADSILFCRHKIYPLGLPNSLSHALTVLALILTAIFGARASFLPSRPRPVSVSVHRQGELSGRFALLLVTTLERLLLNTKPRNTATPIAPLKLMAIEERPATVFRALWAALGGSLGRRSEERAVGKGGGRT